MPTRQQLESALINADKAGDVEAARTLANALKAGQYDSPVEPATDTRQTRRGVRPVERTPDPETEGSFANPVAQGATFGLADELGGLAGAAYGKLSGDIPEDVSFGEAYSGIRDEIRGDTASYAQANPGKALAGEIGGGLLTGGAVGRQVLKKTPLGAGSKVRAGAATGAAEGAVYGAGSAEEGERLKGAGGGALLGAGGGAIAGKAAQKIGDRLAKRAMNARQIKAGSSTKDLARYKVSDTGGLARDPVARQAIGQGFDEGFIQQVKTASPADKRKILKMVRMGKRALKDNRFATSNRINQVIGESLSERVNLLNKNMRQAANRLDSVAKSLKGQQVDYSDPVETFLKDLDDLDIKVSDQGGISVDLQGSMIEGADDARQVLNRIMSRLVRTDVPDAYDVHRLKRFIDNMVTYGKGQEKGLKGEVLGAVKRLRRNLDQSLDETFPEYNRVNTQYSDNRQALDMLQEAWGGKVDMFNDSASKQLGIQSRKLLSNYASGVNQLDAIENAEQTIRKYGGQVDDNIMDLVSAESALRGLLPQKMFNTFQGDLEKAGGNVLGAAVRGDKAGAAVEVGKRIVDKARGRSPENALKTLERLLKDAI